MCNVETAAPLRKERVNKQADENTDETQLQRVILVSKAGERDIYSSTRNAAAAD